MAYVQNHCSNASSWWASLGLDCKTPCDVLNGMRTLCNGRSMDATMYQSELTKCYNACLCSETVYALYGACIACTYRDAATAQASVLIRSYQYWSDDGYWSTDAEDFGALSPAWTSGVNFTNSTFNLGAALAAAQAATPSSSASVESWNASASPATSLGASTSPSCPTPSPNKNVSPSPDDPNEHVYPLVIGFTVGGFFLVTLVVILTYKAIRHFRPLRTNPPRRNGGVMHAHQFPGNPNGSVPFHALPAPKPFPPPPPQAPPAAAPPPPQAILAAAAAPPAPLQHPNTTGAYHGRRSGR